MEKLVKKFEGIIDNACSIENYDGSHEEYYNKCAEEAKKVAIAFQDFIFIEYYVNPFNSCKWIKVTNDPNVKEFGKEYTTEELFDKFLEEYK